ncbi:GPD2 [Cervus elaphus hippelaphus]|uniref:glycerol-3-phosphate dehydrogenase n=1 Tax=Cervus elaphus hippelaphus TaxID=46360 RepID=A0A212C248_CEREH|nr:GPD2 [Cervus elaphus hippelaphus]
MGGGYYLAKGTSGEEKDRFLSSRGLNWEGGRAEEVNLAFVEAADCVSEPVNREPPSREAQILTLKNTSEFDVLVIGGGATGSGCALDAVTRDN